MGVGTLSPQLNQFSTIPEPGTPGIAVHFSYPAMVKKVIQCPPSYLNSAASQSSFLPSSLPFFLLLDPDTNLHKPRRLGKPHELVYHLEALQSIFLEHKTINFHSPTNKQSKKHLASHTAAQLQQALPHWSFVSGSVLVRRLPLLPNVMLPSNVIHVRVLRASSPTTGFSHSHLVIIHNNAHSPR